MNRFHHIVAAPRASVLVGAVTAVVIGTLLAGCRTDHPPAITKASATSHGTGAASRTASSTTAPSSAAPRSTTTMAPQPQEPPMRYNTAYGDPEDPWQQGSFGTDRTGAGAPRVLWTHRCDGPENMLLVDTTLFVIDVPYVATAIDITTGTVLWDTQFGDGESSGDVSAIIHDGVISIFATFEYDVELDARTGQLLKSYSHDDPSPFSKQASRTYGRPEQAANVDPRVSWNDETFQMEGHDPDGSLAWATNSESFVWAFPYGLRSGNTVIISDPAGNVVAIDWPDA